MKISVGSYGTKWDDIPPGGVFTTATDTYVKVAPEFPGGVLGVNLVGGTYISRIPDGIFPSSKLVAYHPHAELMLGAKS